MAENATNAPVASRFVFIYEVPTLAPTAKVRLVGCVVEYDATKGHLVLEHAYPKHATPIPRLCVDVNLILETAPASVFKVGTWVNVIGYAQNTRRHKQKMKDNNLPINEDMTDLQATVVWDADSLRISDYEETLNEQRLAQEMRRRWALQQQAG